MDAFPWIVWYIWEAHNEKVFKGKDISLIDTIQVAQKVAEIWKLAQRLTKERLIEITGAAAGTTYLVVIRHAKVSDAVTSAWWSIRGKRSLRFHELHNNILAIEPPKPGMEYLILFHHMASHKNRLSTGDRMRQWGMVQGCELCGERDEKIDHLFFARPYSYTWNGLARQLVGNCVNPDWK
ncbi:hypothetical protein Bca4012_010783 [Brassica carinata]